VVRQVFHQTAESPWTRGRLYRRNDERTKSNKSILSRRGSQEDFDKLNEALFDDARKANRYANILAPILNNIGNVLYVFVAITGGVLLVTTRRM